MMELRHLRYFVAVAEAEHFSRAARRLHVSQSPLSRQIAQLEAELGVALFVHFGRGVKLTAAGKNFLEGARATLARAALAVDEARAAAAGHTGNVVIGFDDALTHSGLLPRIVAELRRRHPGAHVRLVATPSEDQAFALRDGKVSVCFGYQTPEDDPTVRFRILFRDRIGVVLAPDHRLAGRRTLRIADLRNERVLWAPRSRTTWLYDAVAEAFREHGETLTIAREESNGEALLTLAASGDGITFFPESMTSVVGIGAVLKRVSDLDVVMNARLAWRAADTNEPLIASLLAISSAAKTAKKQIGRGIPFTRR